MRSHVYLFGSDSKSLPWWFLSLACVFEQDKKNVLVEFHEIFESQWKPSREDLVFWLISVNEVCWLITMGLRGKVGQVAREIQNLIPPFWLNKWPFVSVLWFFFFIPTKLNSNLNLSKVHPFRQQEGKFVFEVWLVYVKTKTSVLVILFLLWKLKLHEKCL